MLQHIGEDKMKSFRVWLKQFVGQAETYLNDFEKKCFCDLADDAITGHCDISWRSGHKQIGCFPHEDTKDAWESHLKLHGACREALETLDKAWIAYQTEKCIDENPWKIEYSELSDDYGMWPWHHDLLEREVRSDNELGNSWKIVFVGTWRETENKLRKLVREWENSKNIGLFNTNTIRYERMKMTKKLRYQIIRRDKYKCVICGRMAEDGIKLHVDHILPVSKGGKTIENNLRTLCNDCNLGKGAETS